MALTVAYTTVYFACKCIKPYSLTRKESSSSVMTKPGQNTEDSGLTLWGRRNSSNVQKILWCLTMLGLSARRVDIGGPFGGLDMPDFRSMNPNEQIPVMRDGPIFLWES